jgi:ankyrin repeat protein
MSLPTRRIVYFLTGLCLCLFATGLWAGEIHDAAAAGDLNKVKALLEADPALLESKDNDGNTPLIKACGTLQVAVANYLIAKGANVNAKGMVRGTPLFWAVKNREESLDLIQRLIAKGADVNATASALRNWTILHKAVVQNNLRATKLLIDHGADINVRSDMGTVLQLAINLHPKEEMAKLLVESGAKLQEYSFGNTELHLAAMKGSANVIPILVKHGANVNAVNEYNHTALYYAAKHGHRKVADALIAAGAGKSAIAETNYGKAPQLAARLKRGEAYLWYLGGDNSPCSGYAVKTKGHLLIFNPSGISDSPEAGLANGYLNPNELAGQKITVLITHRSGPSVSELAKAIPGADLILNFKPSADSTGKSDIALYRLAVPNDSFSVGDIKVRTIPAMLRVFFEDKGLGYLVEADGVKIFHPGLHVSANKDSGMDKYRKEIDFLKPFGPIDIAILPKVVT